MMLIKEDIQDIYPLSSLQEGIYFHTRFDAAEAYQVQTVLRFQGRFDLAAMEHAFNTLIARHDIFRTAFVQKAGNRPLQVVLKERRVQLHYEDISDQPVAMVLDAYRRQDRAKRFDLSDDVLMRLAVFRIGAAVYELVWTHHHILMDGWCLPFIEHEFLELYRSAIFKDTARLSAPAQFGDYIRWIGQQDFSGSGTFWHKYLDGLPDAPGVIAGVTVNGAESSPERYLVRIDGAQYEAVRQYVNTAGVTLNHFVQALWALTLAFKNQATDIVFGKVISGRPPQIQGIEGMIGLFINTVPVRIRFSPEETFDCLLKRIWEDSIATLPHLYYPLWKMMEEHPLKQQLVNHIFTFENHPDAPSKGSAYDNQQEWAIEHVSVSEPSSYDFNVIVYEEQGIVVRFDYNKSVYSRLFLQSLEKSLWNIISILTTHEAVTLGDIRDQLAARNTIPDNMQSCLDYWQRSLGKEVAPMCFNRDQALEKEEEVLNVYSFEMEPTLAGEVQRIGKASLQHVHMVLLAGIAGLLHFYQETGDVLIGTPVYGQVEENQGDFYRPVVPVKLVLPDGLTTKSLLQQVRSCLQESMHHARFSIEELAYYLGLAGVKVSDKFFRIGMVLENIQPVSEMLAYRPEWLFAFGVHENGIRCKVYFDDRFYRLDTVARICLHLQEWMRQTLGSPDKPLVSHHCLTPDAIMDIIQQGVGPAVQIPEKPPHRILENIMKERNTATAIRYRDQTLTYETLVAAVHKLTAYLHKIAAVKQGERVAIIAGRSPGVVAALMSIWHTGAVMVPVDPAWPLERMKFIVGECAIRTAFFDQASIALANLLEVENALDLTVMNDWPAPAPDVCDTAPADKNAPAYVMYTSGSTGTPKGCQISHQNLSNYLSWATTVYFRYGGRDVCAWFTSLSFDFTITCILGPLLTGNVLEIMPDEMEVTDILRYCFDSNTAVNMLKLTPSHIRMAENLGIGKTNVRLIVAGGEALDGQHVEFLKSLRPDLRILNEYGPTEATVGCIVQEVALPETGVPIGRPINNTAVLILDQQGRVCPVGKTGELFIAGASLSEGYLNREDLTAERFVCFPPLNGIAYRTGDLASWMPDGLIYYHGRRDSQVKLRGYRIELQEIEGALLGYGPVSGAVASYVKEEEDAYLLVYYTADEPLPAGELRKYLQTRLPAYMVPQYFMHVKRFDLTTNGKVDVKALPVFKKEEVANKGQQEGPRNEMEAQLMMIWQEILGNRHFSTSDNFFESGGHSLKATLLMGRIYQQFGVSIPFRSLFDNATIAGLARVLRKASRSAMAVIPAAPPATDYLLSHAQMRLWILDRFNEGTVAYTIPAMYRISGYVDVQALEKAFSLLIARHGSLRTVFADTPEGPRQRILPATDIRVPFEFYRHDSTDGDNPDVLVELAATALRQPFDLEKGPLLRIKLIELSDDQYFFLFTIHHLIADGWSMEIMINEVLIAYEAIRAGKTVSLPPLPVQYVDYVYWQRRTMTEQHMQKQALFWQEQLQQVDDYTLDLPLDYERTAMPTFKGDNLELLLSTEEVMALTAYATQTQSSLFTVLFSITSIALSRFSGKHQFYLGTVSSGRKHPQLERLIGYFLNTVAIKQEIINDETFHGFLLRNNQQLRDVLENDDYPFDVLVEELGLRKTAARSPVFDVLLVMQNKEYATPVTVSSLRLQEWSPPRNTSTYDLVLSFSEQDDGLKIIWDYSSDLYEKETIMVWIKEYNMLIKELLMNWSITVENLISFTATFETEDL